MNIRLKSSFSSSSSALKSYSLSELIIFLSYLNSIKLLLGKLWNVISSFKNAGNLNNKVEAVSFTLGKISYKWTKKYFKSIFSFYSSVNLVLYSSKSMIGIIFYVPIFLRTGINLNKESPRKSGEILLCRYEKDILD